MKKLSSDLERRLMSALETAAAHVNAGDDPTAAIVKAAGAHQLPPGGVTKLVHAFNTARTTRQREDNSDIQTKTADFPLADAAKALEAIYPDKVKTAAEIVREQVISPEYRHSPAELLRQRDRVKLAAQPMPPLPANPMRVYQKDTSHEIRRAYGTADRCQKETEEARRKESAALDKVGSTFCQLTTLFLRPSSLPLDIVRRNAEIMHGEKGAQLIDQIVAVSPNLPKMAQHKPSDAMRKYASQQPAVGPIYDLVNQMMVDIANHALARKHHAATKEANDARAAAALDPFAAGVGDPSILDAGLPIRSSVTSSGRRDKQALPSVWQGLGSFALAKGMFDGIAKDMKAPDEGQMVQKTLNKLTDPEHESQLRAINTQATLQDFMLNDPVISGHDPQDVMDAFNEVTQLSPSVSDQRLPLQAILRKRLQQGSLDTFDVDQILKLEQGLRQRNLIPSQKGTVPGASFA